MWREIFIFNVAFILQGQCTDGHCIDIHSHIVSQGLHYIPGPNSCKVCICDKGSPKLCKSVLCTQPTNCKSFQRGNSCCDFKCLDDILEGNTSYKDTYDLALPLFASVVFAVITLSLLFFVVHRFRRRKLHDRHTRQISEDQRSLNSIGYIAGGLRYLPGNIGYLRSGNNDLDFHYEDTTNHLSLWKPPGNYFPRGEAPPPYDEAVRSQSVNSGNNRNQESSVSETNAHIQHYGHVNQNSDVNHQISSNRTVRAETSNQNDTNSRPESVNKSNQYKNCKVQDFHEILPLVEQTKTEVSSNGLPPKDVQSSFSQGKSTIHSKADKSKRNPEKLKCCENVGGASVLEGAKPSSTSSHHHSIADKTSNEKTKEYNEVLINTLSHVIMKDKNPSRTLEKFNKLTQKCLEENRYENVGFSAQKLRHRSIPAPIEFQNERKTEPKVKETPKTTSNVNASTSRNSREQIFLIDSKAAPYFLKDLKKSLEDCQDSSCSILRDPNDVPVFTVCRSKEMLQDSHQTLPKSLKELISDSTINDHSSNYLSLKYTGNHSLHRSLPRHLNNSEISLSANVDKTHKNDCMKECPLLRPVNLHSSASNMVPSVSRNKPKQTDVKKKEESNPISYQCLVFSQDDDDYRSECENCKAVDSAADEEDGDVFNETMTLQRRPVETGEDLQYYRTSLTLPSQIKKPRTILPNPSRENWFRAMQETSSSDESD